jgi:hypothetical protein
VVWYHPPTSHASERVCHSGAAAFCPRGIAAAHIGMRCLKAQVK